VKLVTAAQMREIDRRAIEEYGIPSLLLMENAGATVARRAEALAGFDVASFVVMCGKGNNGGDGFVAARRLWNRGHAVVCYLTIDPGELKGDVRTNYELTVRSGVSIRAFSRETVDFGDADVIIDALLGTGFIGDPRGAVAEAIQVSNSALVSILSVDVPSGLDATTGRASEICIRASETVTFGLAKVGLAQYPGRELAGEITVADISLPRALLAEDHFTCKWLTEADVQGEWHSRRPNAHKGDSGRVLLVAGSPGLTGAAAMSATAALRGGAGLVTVGVPKSLRDPMAVKLTEAMSLPLPETPDGALSPDALPPIHERLPNLDALAIGPGLGRDPSTGELVRALLRACSIPMVVDADGLNLVAPVDGDTFPTHCVITPHPGEMARLLDTTVDEVEADRLECAREASKRFGCVVVLKGPATVIAAPDGQTAINSSGGPALATGGTGDVLTGLIAACLARGLAPYEAAMAGVYLHGIAGEIAGERIGAPGAIAGDVIDAIPEAIARVQSRKTASPYRTI
jgi:ADP-dependent NAD(P)H-hydrate dehydratase / NAD(P)H-hydrate epimerase